MQFNNSPSVLFLNRLREQATKSISPNVEDAVALLKDTSIRTEDILAIAEIPRKTHFDNYVQIHVINNIKNGSCSEDCSYCAQRKGPDDSGIVRYSSKDEDEILAEAKSAFENGAFRYCLVTAGRSPSTHSIQFFSNVIKKIKELYPMEVCLSAGILTNPDQAALLSSAGLDRYNHNLNTSMAHYDDICTTHQFQDRIDTLMTMGKAGVSLCSGIIVGMGESEEDLVDVAYRLRENRVASIPVNFFLPIPGHKVRASARELNADYALRVLSMFRLVNPDSEIRMAAGREIYLKDKQGTALRVANSLFVSGYLNVKGSNTHETISMILREGYRIDSELSDIQGTPADPNSNESVDSIRLKEKSDLRPFADKQQ